MSDQLEEYRQKVVGTNIDQRSLLSTDYFNTFNSVAMLFDMLPDAPELLEEVEQWQFYTYVEHFQSSGLAFASLAIEAYAHVPSDLKKAFEDKIAEMRVLVLDATQILRHLYDFKNRDAFAQFAHLTAHFLHSMEAEGGSIIHGYKETLAQDAIDNMF